MKAVITCAGYGSRLWPLTKNTPKALLSIKGESIATHIVLKIEEISEVDEIILVTNNKFYSHFQKWLEASSFNTPIKILNDGTLTNETRMGQVGDLGLAIKKANISEDLLVVAGDNLFNFSLLDAYSLFKKVRKVVNPVWESKSIRTAKESGTVVLDKDRKFEKFTEKNPSPYSTLISLGIYFFPKDELVKIKGYVEDKHNNLDKMGFFLEWLMSQSEVYGYVYFDEWFDIGWIESLESARKKF